MGSLYVDGESSGFSIREEPEFADNRTPVSELQRQEAIRTVRSCIRTMPKRARAILERRYGLHDPPETLTQIGRRYRLTKQRISQLEAAAIEQLRSLIANRDGNNEI
jgi:RNA polymerase sigma factor (sigma-70 family)